MAARAQPMEALEHANRVRFLASEMKRKLHDGEVELEEILTHPDLQRIRLVTVLKSMRNYGHHRSAELLRDAGIGPSFLGYEIGRLTERQKQALAEEVKLPPKALRGHPTKPCPSWGCKNRCMQQSETCLDCRTKARRNGGVYY